MRDLIIILTAALLFVVAGCTTSPTEAEEDPVPENPGVDSLSVEVRTYRIGVSGLVPRDWPQSEADDWEDLFALLPSYGELFGVHVGWDVDLNDEGIPTQVEVAYLATGGKDVDPYVALGFEPEAMTPEEADTYFEVHGEAFRDVAVAVAGQYKPAILLLGVEANRYFETSPEGFDDFVQVYHETYDAIKAVSPSTLVGTNFQYEYMLGEAALTGQPHTEHLDLIDRFDGKLDLVTLTVYPWFDYDEPDQIPLDYFSPIRAHTNVPLMITETGWPSREISNSGIVGSEQAQVDYLNRMLTILAGESAEALIWVFPHDPLTGVAGGIFDHVSLRENDGMPKKAWDYWQVLRSLDG